MVVSADQMPISGDSHTEPAGASCALTSNDSTVVQARRLADDGHVEQAEALLQSAPPAREREEMLEIVRRIRIAYNLDGGALLAKLRLAIPDIAAKDLDRWRVAGVVQFRTIDGRIGYFGREPANLFRFCDEAKRRRKPSTPETNSWVLEQHLARVIAAAREQGKAEVLPIRHRVRYALTVPAHAPRMNLGALIRVWLPFPQEYTRQCDVRLISTNPKFSKLAPSAAGEYPIHGAPQRTIYFEQPVTDPGVPASFEAIFEFTSSAYYPILEDAKARPLPVGWSGGNLGERPPHIVFTPKLRQTAAQIVGDERNPLARARRSFQFVSRNIAYCAEEEYGTIPSLSEKALTSRRGDCGVQTMLFITMCRCAGIPARWQSGWQTRRDRPDMHDWAEFYVEPWGWLPADPSYGLRTSDDPGVREFYFGHQDAYRMIVNRDYGCELVPSKLSLRSEPLDFQRGEVEIDGHNLYFPDWEWDINVEWMDSGP